MVKDVGGRGASSNSDSFAVKRGGGIFQYRKIRESDNVWSGNGGLMEREYGTKEWHFTREPRSNIVRNGYKLYPINAKAVNPKNYVTSSQQRKNNELKEKIKERRSGSKTQIFSETNKVVGYKNGRRVIDKSYRRSEMSYALETKRANLQDAKVRATPLFGGKPSKADVRHIKKLERGIRSLERQLKGLN